MLRCCRNQTNELLKNFHELQRILEKIAGNIKQDNLILLDQLRSKLRYDDARIYEVVF